MSLCPVKRWIGDDILRKRLAAEALVFLTQDEELEDVPADLRSQVIISHLLQHLPIRERVEIWFAALEKLVERRPPERLFEVLPSGELVAWEVIEPGRRLRGSI